MTYREAIVSGEKSLCEAGIADARNDAWLLLTWHVKLTTLTIICILTKRCRRNCSMNLKC